MNAEYQIHEIDYSLIRRASNLDNFKRNLLMGHAKHYVAVRIVSGKFEVIVETIGRRDDCAKKLQDYLSKQQDITV